eukprot:9770-Heterococcus_DN1.PRE.2
MTGNVPQAVRTFCIAICFEELAGFRLQQFKAQHLRLCLRDLEKLAQGFAVLLNETMREAVLTNSQTGGFNFENHHRNTRIVQAISAGKGNAALPRAKLTEVCSFVQFESNTVQRSMIVFKAASYRLETCALIRSLLLLAKHRCVYKDGIVLGADTRATGGTELVLLAVRSECTHCLRDILAVDKSLTIISASTVRASGDGSAAYCYYTTVPQIAAALKVAYTAQVIAIARRTTCACAGASASTRQHTD